MTRMTNTVMIALIISVACAIFVFVTNWIIGGK
jgi:hypothetical protein